MLSSEEVAMVQNTTPKSSTAKPSSSASITKHQMLQIVRKFVKIFFPSIVFLKIFFSSIIPPMADNIIPLFFTGNISDESALAVASQFMFVGIIIKIIEEGVGNSLFHFVGSHYKQNAHLTLVAFKLSIVVLLVAGILLTAMILVFTPQFVNLIDTPKSISEATKHFLYTSAFSFIPILLKTAFINYLLISTSTWLVIAQITTVVISFFINFFMFGQQSFSLQWGIEKLGIYKIIQSILSLIVSIIFVLAVEKMGPITFFVKIPFFEDFKKNSKAFFKVSWGNFADSIVRNFFYFAVTLKFINNLGADEAAAWNLFNGIVWGIILIPVYVVANYLKVCIGHNSCSKSIIKNLALESAICLTAWIILMTTITILMWPILSSLFSKSNENVALLSLNILHNIGWVFVVFAYDNAVNSFFLGTGQTKYVFYQSFLTNLIVYFIPWTLYLIGIVTPTYWWVMGLYIAGMLLHFCFGSYYCIIVWKSYSSD